MAADPTVTQLKLAQAAGYKCNAPISRWLRESAVSAKEVLYIEERLWSWLEVYERSNAVKAASAAPKPDAASTQATAAASATDVVATDVASDSEQGMRDSQGEAVRLRVQQLIDAEQGLTLEKLANALGYSVPCVDAWLRDGWRGLSADKPAWLCHFEEALCRWEHQYRHLHCI